MKLNRNLGMVLLAIWLIATGVLSLTSINVPGVGLIMAVLALAAGVLILLKR